MSIPYVNRPVYFIINTAQAVNSLENSGGSPVKLGYREWKELETESCQLHLDGIPDIQTLLNNVSSIADWEKLEAFSWKEVISTNVYGVVNWKKNCPTYIIIFLSNVA